MGAEGSKNPEDAPGEGPSLGANWGGKRSAGEGRGGPYQALAPARQHTGDRETDFIHREARPPAGGKGPHGDAFPTRSSGPRKGPTLIKPKRGSRLRRMVPQNSPGAGKTIKSSRGARLRAWETRKKGPPLSPKGLKGSPRPRTGPGAGATTSARGSPAAPPERGATEELWGGTPGVEEPRPPIFPNFFFFFLK